MTFVLRSEDGDQGYPSNLDVKVTYILTDNNEVFISYFGAFLHTVGVFQGAVTVLHIFLTVSL